MNRLTYIIKAFYLLSSLIVRRQPMPYHSKRMPVSDNTLPENKKYLHNGIIATAKGILKGECKLHWLRDN